MNWGLCSGVYAGERKLLLKRCVGWRSNIKVDGIFTTAVFAVFDLLGRSFI